MSTHLEEPNRPNYTKAFAESSTNLKAASTKELYESDPMFKDANRTYKNCLMYAAAYTETMLTRAKAEEPEIFALKGMSKSEMQAHMVNNICLPYKKIQARVFRDRTAKINEDTYLKDEIRRLYNGGDKFHPYM